MDPRTRSRFTFASLLFLVLIAAVSSAAAQYYPPPPPPYPPPYPTTPAPPSQPPRDSGRGPAYPHYGPTAPYLSVYGMFSAGHYSGLGVGVGTPPTQSGGMTALGGTFGGYVTYPSSSPVNVGADVRLVVENSANSTPNGNKILGGLVGVRIDGSGAQLPVDPYFQFEIGGVGTNNGTSTSRTGAFAYQAQFGADIPFASNQIAARVEYGTGQLVGISGTNHTLQTFSAGIVIHLR